MRYSKWANLPEYMAHFDYRFYFKSIIDGSEQFSTFSFWSRKIQVLSFRWSRNGSYRNRIRSTLQERHCSFEIRYRPKRMNKYLGTIYSRRNLLQIMSDQWPSIAAAGFAWKIHVFSKTGIFSGAVEEEIHQD